MTDRLTCPDCGGDGQQRIGWLTLQCRFCLGAGYVGDDNEPAEDSTLRAPQDIPVWQEPAMREFAGCTRCLGTGRIVGLGGDVTGGVPSSMVEAPCPVCSA